MLTVTVRQFNHILKQSPAISFYQPNVQENRIIINWGRLECAVRVSDWDPKESLDRLNVPAGMNDLPGL